MMKVLSVCRMGIDVEFSAGGDCKINGIGRTLRIGGRGFGVSRSL